MATMHLRSRSWEGLEAEGAGAEAEFGAEGVIEIGDVAEAGVEGYVENFGWA